MSNRIANYEIVQETLDLLLIRDLGPWDRYMTITNAAEQVVADLAPRLGNRRLEYFDSEGERGQILVQDGKFVGFAPTGRKQYIEQRNRKIVEFIGKQNLPSVEIAKFLGLSTGDANSILKRMEGLDMLESNKQQAGTGKARLFWRVRNGNP